MTSKGNTLTIQMHSDYIVTRTGFKVSYVISELEAMEGMGRPIICFHYGLMCNVVVFRRVCHVFPV